MRKNKITLAIGLALMTSVASANMVGFFNGKPTTDILQKIQDKHALRGVSDEKEVTSPGFELVTSEEMILRADKVKSILVSKNESFQEGSNGEMFLGIDDGTFTLTPSAGAIPDVDTSPEWVAFLNNTANACTDAAGQIVITDITGTQMVACDGVLNYSSLPAYSVNTMAELILLNEQSSTSFSNITSAHLIASGFSGDYAQDIVMTDLTSLTGSSLLGFGAPFAFYSGGGLATGGIASYDNLSFPVLTDVTGYMVYGDPKNFSMPNLTTITNGGLIAMATGDGQYTPTDMYRTTDATRIESVDLRSLQTTSGPLQFDGINLNSVNLDSLQSSGGLNVFMSDTATTLYFPSLLTLGEGPMMPHMRGLNVKGAALNNINFPLLTSVLGEVRFGNAKNVSMPSLTHVTEGNFMAMEFMSGDYAGSPDWHSSDSTLIESADLRSLVKVDGMLFLDGANLNSINLSSLQEVGGLMLPLGSTITSVSLPNFTGIVDANTDNPAVFILGESITSIDLSSLTTLGSESYIGIKTPLMTDFSFMSNLSNDTLPVNGNLVGAFSDLSFLSSYTELGSIMLMSPNLYDVSGLSSISNIVGSITFETDKIYTVKADGASAFCTLAKANSAKVRYPDLSTPDAFDYISATYLNYCTF